MGCFKIYIRYFKILTLASAIVWIGALQAQDVQKYAIELGKIDSIVSTGYAREALPIASKIYPEIRSFDTTSAAFKRLCTNYLFALENTDLNEKAIEFSDEILTLNLGNEVDANVYITLALIHEKASNKEFANEYLELAYPLAFGSSNDSLKAVWFIRSSSLHHVTDNRDSARFFAEKAYLLSKQIENKSTIATSALLYGFFAQNDSLQLQLKHEALEMFLAVKDYRLGLSQCLGLYAKYRELNNEEKALEYLEKAREIGKNTHLVDIKSVLFNTLKKKYARDGDFEKAFVYADSFAMVREQIFEQSDRIKVVSSDFKFKNNRLKNDLNKAELIAAQQEEEKQVLIYSITITLAFFILILFIAYDQRKKRREATENQIIIKQRNADLRKANAENKLLMQEMNHRIKNNFSTLSALLEIQANQESNVKVKEALQKSLERIDLLANLHKRMLNFDSQHLLAADEVILDVINSQLFLFNTQKNNVSISIDPIRLRTKALTALTFVINELLTNALKHGQKNGSPQIDISLKKENKNVTFSITNSGSRMPDDYQISNQNSSGMYITNLLVQQLGGELCWTSTENSTTFYFSFLV